MFCSKCGKQIDNDAIFCKFCGSSTFSNISSANNAESGSKGQFAGKISKCPNCGEAIDSFLTKCPLCGVEIHRTDVASSVRLLVDQLQQLESQRPPQGYLKSFLSRTYLANAVSDIDSKKIDLIRNFPIPNSKEDIIEFLFLAFSSIDMSAIAGGSVWRPIPTSLIELARAWDSKADQAYQKAKYMMFSDPEFPKIQSMYEQKERDKKTAAKNRRKSIFGVVMLAIAPILLMALMALFIVWLWKIT